MSSLKNKRVQLDVSVELLAELAPTMRINCTLEYIRDLMILRSVILTSPKT